MRTEQVKVLSFWFVFQVIHMGNTVVAETTGGSV